MDCFALLAMTQPAGHLAVRLPQYESVFLNYHGRGS